MARRVLVTGANGGIGRAIVFELLRRGFHVVGAARSEEDLAAVVRWGATPLRLDLLEPSSVAAAADTLAGAPLWGVVQNAGYGQFGAIQALPAEAWRRQFEVNVFATVELTRRLLPQVRSVQGRIVLVGSLAGRISLPGMGAYCASKFALEAVADALRVEMLPSRVRVVIIEPGPVPTGFQRRVRKELQASGLPDDVMNAHAVGFSESRLFAVPATRVARRVAAALVRRRPRARYRVGWWSSMGVRLAAAMPTRVRDAVVRRRSGL